ncbi:MAG: C25 family peptidase propeptide domain-containing protein, partial [Thermodesulfobacteriota bacterium]|nr:C25 family peptidase propeptide domain-containing protein [Thermodesulfobacteriota bacterium]
MIGARREIWSVAMALVLSFLCAPPLSAQDPPEWIDFNQGLSPDISNIEVANSSATSLMLKVALPGMYTHSMEMEDGETYTALSVPGATVFENGKPAVPVFSRWILIPEGTEAVVSVDEGAPLTFTEVYLPPVQPLSGDCDGELIVPFAKDEETYGTPEDCPGDFARLEPGHVMRGQECAMVWLFPYQHDPVAKTLKVYPQLSVTISFEGGAPTIPPEVRSTAFEDVMRRMAVNGDEVLPVEGPPDEYDTGPYGWDYIIVIGDSKFEPAANKLAAWKKKAGFKTLVHKVPKSWDELAIKNALAGAYKN